MKNKLIKLLGGYTVDEVLFIQEKAEEGGVRIKYNRFLIENKIKI